MRERWYTYEKVKEILQAEEKSGKLKSGTYPADSGIWELMQQMKQKRKEIRQAHKEEREELRLELKHLQAEYIEKTEKEQEKIAEEIVSRKYEPQIKYDAFAKVYETTNTSSMVVAKIIAKELKHAYGLQPQNRDVIVEQMHGLLDGEMPKVVLRADVCDFYDSIPQEPLLQRIVADGKLTSYSMKYLRSFFYQYNMYRPEDEELIGIPKGLSFSAYLAELYMDDIDKKIREIPGVYFYKRYVDDMVIVANPEKGTADEYWRQLKACFEGTGLTIHDDSEKKHVALWDKETNDIGFTYLGYRFQYKGGKLDVLLSQKRYHKYRILIEAIFEIYEKCAKGMKWKDDENRMKPLSELVKRLRVLTGNGLLQGHKCFIASGVYYSNKHLTSTSQLEELDAYLYAMIDGRFCPPAKLYDYDKTGDDAKFVVKMRADLKKYSFVKSFNKPKLMKSFPYETTLTQLKRIYLSRTGE